ncbi:hypothetical protein AN958_02799 [Leucoagaricus sp. SymC.cos]|nr:hypothetical protein AN958_02799 [Leucoagaricus sp. SymC.cos]
MSDMQMSSSFTGFFNHAHHFTINNPTMVDVNCDAHSLGLLSRHTIPGAEFDSSARDPPPRCHPGTRLDISTHLHTWVRNLAREKNLAWLFGPAGVGKSAIMQSLAEDLTNEDLNSDSEILGATLFFSRAFKRDDPHWVVPTLAYQLAVKFPSYRKYVVDLLNKDPKVVEKSFAEQFKRFIVKPFVKKGSLTGLSQENILIILDGLDECAGEAAQRQIILTIGGFVLQNPDSPLLWIMASRPEPHIKAAFCSKAIWSAWLEVEVPVNSTQACLDVELYLRFEFDSIREKYPLVFDLDSEETDEQWPPEIQFVKVAKSSKGLFVFATTATRFIDDPNYGNPISQLNRILDVIDSVPQTAGHVAAAAASPFAALDALYLEILSHIPPDILPTTRNILGCMTKPYPTLALSSLSKTSNWLGLTQAHAYGALQKLHSVIDIPKPQEKERALRAFHASFIDFLVTPTRSGTFSLYGLDVKRKQFNAASRILEEAYDADQGKVEISHVNLSWPTREENTWHFDLFLQAFELLLRAEPDVLDGTLWSKSSYRTSFFGALELGTIIRSSPTGRLNDYRWQWSSIWPLLTSIHTSPALSRLKEDKLFRVVPISMLNVECINMNTSLIFRDGTSNEGCFATASEPLEEPAVLALLKKFGPVVLPTETWMITPKANSPEWMKSVLDKIVATSKECPSDLTVVYGQGQYGSVLMRLVFPDANWLVFASYKS